MWTQIKLVVDLVMALFRGDFSAAFDALKAMVANSIGMIVDIFVALPMNILNAAKPLVGKFALIVADVAVYLVGKIRKLIRDLPGQIVDLISNAASSMLSVGKDVGQWIIDGLLAAIRAAAGAVMAAVQSLIPDIGSMVSGAVGGIGGALKGAFGFGATGGIVTQPTLAMIGEAGPEAVIPLSRTPGSSPLPGGGTTFNIVVNAGMGTDGHQVGNQIVSALKQWERSNGSLPLTVSAA
jgi:hypothetical protein